MDCRPLYPHDDVRDGYRQDDIVRGLHASLVAVLTTALAGTDANFDFLKGVISLAQSQAALYGIPWTDVMASLKDMPALCLVQNLQIGASACLLYQATGPAAP